MSDTTPPLPTVLANAVIRMAKRGTAHGLVYLVDLATEQFLKVIDWDDQTIDFSGRGRDRGLRGMAIAGDRVYIASSHRIHVFDPQLRPVRTLENQYLHNIHEIVVDDGLLYVTSTGFNAVLAVDLSTGKFVDGYWIRYSRLGRMLRRHRFRPTPYVSKFDPNGPNGPIPGGHLHINSVTRSNGKTYVSGTHMGRLIELHDSHGKTAAKIPFLSHNAQPFEQGAILNDTSRARLAILDSTGNVLETYATPTYDPATLQNAYLPPHLARQGFARGLVVWKPDVFIAGSSPATISVYSRGNPKPIRSVKLLDDIRGAIHGVELWPFTCPA